MTDPTPDAPRPGSPWSEFGRQLADAMFPHRTPRQDDYALVPAPEFSGPPAGTWHLVGKTDAGVPVYVSPADAATPAPLGADALAAVRDALGAVDDALEEDELYLATDGMQIRMRYPWLSRTLEDRGVDLEAFERRLGDLGAL